MMQSSFFGLLLGALLIGLPACAATGGSDPVATKAMAAEEPDAGKDQKSQEKREDLERKLEIANRKLDKAILESSIQEKQSADRLRQAERELALAEARMEQFQQYDRPNRLASAQLSLQGARDRAKEAEEELAQIELMYRDQDLNDMTAEFVVARGKRNADRRKEQIRIEERSLESLEKQTLPQEMQKLALEVDRKTADLENARREAENGRLGKQIGVMTAEAEVAKLEQELVTSSGEQKE